VLVYVFGVASDRSDRLGGAGVVIGRRQKTCFKRGLCCPCLIGNGSGEGKDEEEEQRITLERSGMMPSGA
jgi:hypothetical protein